MLAGQRAFDGDSTVDVLAAVVHEEPDFTKLPGGTPRVIQALVRRCLTEGSGRAPGRDRSGPHAACGFRREAETRRNLALASIAGAVVVGAFSFIWFGTRTLRDRAPASSSGDNRPDVTRFAALTPVQMTVSKGFDGFAQFAPDGWSVAFSSGSVGVHGNLRPGAGRLDRRRNSSLQTDD